MNSSKEMTIILDRAYSILDKNDKLKIKKIITEINKPMKAPNNFPQLIRSAIKETAKVQKIKISQEKYYDKFLYNLDNRKSNNRGGAARPAGLAALFCKM